MPSHDVRQPLTSILAASSLLNEDWTELPDTERQHYVTRISAAASRADHLVAEILTLAQLDAGAIIARPVRVDLADASAEAIAVHAPAGGQRISLLAPDQIVAMADPSHLQLILGNLIGNALKYGAPPFIIRITNRGDQVDLLVTDHGDGIPEDFIPRLFDRFTRAASGVAVTKPGSGLGLYLVRQLAEAGGITIGYRPHHPHGSTFALTMPGPALPTSAGFRMLNAAARPQNSSTASPQRL